MASLSLVNFLDASRSLGDDPGAATPRSVADWFEKNYLISRGGGFNYDPAAQQLFPLFMQATNVAQAMHMCSTSGNPAGRAQNADVIALVGPYAFSRPSSCYRIRNRAVRVGRVKDQNIFLAIKAPLIRVEHDKAFVVVPGFRKSHMPSERQIDIACSIVRNHIARDDYGSADIEYLFAGADDSKQRYFRPIHGCDRDLFSQEEVDAFVDIYVKGIALLMDRGETISQPSFKGFDVFDPTEPRLL